MALSQIDADAQYSQDLERAIAMSKESAREEMEKYQAIEESKAMAGDSSPGEKYPPDEADEEMKEARAMFDVSNEVSQA